MNQTAREFDPSGRIAVSSRHVGGMRSRKRGGSKECPAIHSATMYIITARDRRF